jgi:hypothetical protein
MNFLITLIVYHCKIFTNFTQYREVVLNDDLIFYVNFQQLDEKRNDHWDHGHLQPHTHINFFNHQ